MNLLPLVIVFFLIFGAISSSFLSHQIAEKTEALSYKGKIRAIRIGYNDLEELEYDRSRIKSKGQTKKKKKENKKEDNEKKEEKIYFRIKQTGSIHGAINLAQLTKNHVTNPWLEEKTIEYLNVLYGKTRIIQELKNPNWAKELLKFIVAKQKQAYKKNQTFLPLDKISPEGSLETYYSRLLRGTNSFDPMNPSLGYFPLDRCLTFSKDANPPINLYFANPQLLIVLMGKKAYQLIHKKEWPNEKPRKGAKYISQYSLSKQEFKELLGKTFNHKLEELTYVKYKKGTRGQIASDPQTFISVQIPEVSTSQ